MKKLRVCVPLLFVGVLLAFWLTSVPRSERVRGRCFNPLSPEEKTQLTILAEEDFGTKRPETREDRRGTAFQELVAKRKKLYDVTALEYADTEVRSYTPPPCVGLKLGRLYP